MRRMQKRALGWIEGAFLSPLGISADHFRTNIVAGFLVVFFSPFLVSVFWCFLGCLPLLEIVAIRELYMKRIVHHVLLGLDDLRNKGYYGQSIACAGLQAHYQFLQCTL